MKTFFQAFLYLNVCCFSLFFIIWLVTSTSFLEPVASAKEPANTPPVNPSASAPPIKPESSLIKQKKVEVVKDTRTSVVVNKRKPSSVANDGKSSASVLPPGKKQDADSLEKEGVSSISQKDGAIPSPSAVDSTAPIPPPPSVDNTAPVPPPPPVEDNSLSETEAGQKNNIPGAISSGISSSQLEELMKSAQKIKDKQGTSADAAHDLMHINQEIVDVYKMLSIYQYDPKERRDPFTPFNTKEFVDDGKEVIPEYPTGKYNLNELTLVGIKWDSSVGPPRAFFKTPDNVTHKLQKNDLIGSNMGIIYQLREDEVVILEPRFVAGDSSDEDLYEPIIVQLRRYDSKEANEKMLDQGEDNIKTKKLIDTQKKPGTGT